MAKAKAAKTGAINNLRKGSDHKKPSGKKMAAKIPKAKTK